MGRRYAERRAQHICESSLVSHARIAGRGIGAAAHGQERCGRRVSTCAARIDHGEMCPAQQHGRGSEPVGRERGSDGSGPILHEDDGQVRPARLLDPGGRRTGPKATRQAR